LKFSHSSIDQSCATTSCITGRQWKRVLLSSESNNIPKVMLLIAMTDQAQDINYLKAHLLVKSQPKSWPSVRHSPLLYHLFLLLQLHQFICNNMHYLPTLRRVLLSSQSNKIPKVVLLIVNKDQARVLHYRKADVLVKSQPKRRPSVRQSPLLHRLFCSRSIYLQQSASPADCAAHVIIKPK